MKTEIWKDIEGYEGLYQVSNFGKIKSLGNKNCHKNELILKLGIRNTYYVINLTKNNNRKSFQVHRLVANAFIPNPYNYPIVNHKDENPLNNNVDNLEWCTQKHNVIHSKHKMYKQRKIIYSDINEKYIFKSKSSTTIKGKRYVYDYFRVMIKQIKFDCRYSTLEKAIQVRNEKLLELDEYYSNINH